MQDMEDKMLNKNEVESVVSEKNVMVDAKAADKLVNVEKTISEPETKKVNEEKTKKIEGEKVKETMMKKKKEKVLKEKKVREKKLFKKEPKEKKVKEKKPKDKTAGKKFSIVGSVKKLFGAGKQGDIPATDSKKHLKTQILMISIIPMMVVGVFSCVISYNRTHELNENSMETTLRALALSVRDSYDQINNEEYVNKGSDEIPKIYKGSYNVSKHTEIVDTISEEAGMEATFFWNNMRVMTSLVDEQGERKIGTTLDDEVVIEKVLGNGEGHFETGFDIGGENFYVYYLPVYQYNSDDVIGMIFVGAHASDVDAGVNSMLVYIVAVVIIIILLAVLFINFMTVKIAKALAYGVYVLNNVADGNLVIELDESALKREDEIGNLLKAVAALKNRLTAIVGDIKNNSISLIESSKELEHIAKETETTVEQVEKAVEDIAQGANSQAAETQRASEDVLVMGDLITKTSEEVQILDENANNMKRSSDEATITLGELKAINERAIEAIDIIYEQTNTTNESALKIQKATNLITSIAEETNLLSLNASIEAARAGEQGRGFTVVAKQIQKLAEQSNESALRIEEIITSLLKDSEKAVKTMDEVKQIMDKQNANMIKTEEIFDTVKVGIDESFVRVEGISNRTERLDESRVSIVDIVQNLSAVAEENAASTEETSAASAEVAATVSNVSDAAENLKKIADELERHMSIFRI